MEERARRTTFADLLELARLSEEKAKLEEALTPNSEWGLPDRADQIRARLAFVQAAQAIGFVPRYAPNDSQDSRSMDALLKAAEQEDAAAARREDIPFDPVFDAWWKAEVAAEGRWQHERHHTFCRRSEWLGRALHRSSFEEVSRIIAEHLSEAQAREDANFAREVAEKSEAPFWEAVAALVWISTGSIEDIIRNEPPSGAAFDAAGERWHWMRDGQPAFKLLQHACKTQEGLAYGDCGDGRQSPIPLHDWAVLEIECGTGADSFIAAKRSEAGWGGRREWRTLRFRRDMLMRLFPSVVAELGDAAEDATRDSRSGIAAGVSGNTARTQARKTTAINAANNFVLSQSAAVRRNERNRVRQGEVRTHIEGLGLHLTDDDMVDLWDSFRKNDVTRDLVQGRGRPPKPAQINSGKKSVR